MVVELFFIVVLSAMLVIQSIYLAGVRCGWIPEAKDDGKLKLRAVLTGRYYNIQYRRGLFWKKLSGEWAASPEEAMDKMRKYSEYRLVINYP